MQMLERESERKTRTRIRVELRSEAGLGRKNLQVNCKETQCFLQITLNLDNAGISLTKHNVSAAPNFDEKVNKNLRFSFS